MNKKTPNIVILGGGIAGLIAAWVLRAFKPLLLESAPNLGGNFLAGGLKYIRCTPLVEAMLKTLDIGWNIRAPRGMLHNPYGPIPYVAHPTWINDQPGHIRRAIMEDHWLKTRGTMDGFRPDCMNDPGGNGAQHMVDCDLSKLLKQLENEARRGGAELRTRSAITAIHDGSITNHGSTLAYDILIPTIPLPIMAKLAPWAGLPNVNARQLNIVEWNLDNVGHPQWDYMYNPMYPAGSSNYSASRYTWPARGVFQAEVPKVDTSKAFNGDLEAITAEAMRVLSPWWAGASPRLCMSKVIPGHLTPLEQPLVFPDCWRPLGRFAQWEPRATSERVLDSAEAIRQELLA